MKVNAVKNILLGRSQNSNVYSILVIAKALNYNIYELLGERLPESSETPMMLECVFTKMIKKGQEMSCPSNISEEQWELIKEHFDTGNYGKSRKGGGLT